jgi:hypothetical protein
MTFLRIVILLYLFVLACPFSQNRFPLLRDMLWDRTDAAQQNRRGFNRLLACGCHIRPEHDPEKWVPVFGKDHAPTKQ